MCGKLSVKGLVPIGLNVLLESGYKTNLYKKQIT